MSSRPPDFSNVRGGTSSAPASSTPDFSNVQGGTSAVQGGGGARSDAGRDHHYTVERGDTLSGIAKRFYGRSSRWREIFEANRDQVDDPDLIRPGQSLLIPHVDETDRSGASR